MPEPLEQHFGLVRRARTNDADAIARIDAESFTEPWSKEDWCRQIAEPNALLYVVPKNTNLIVGFLLARCVADEAEIFNLAVMSSCRRQGVAKSMLAQLIADLRRDLHRRLFLEVSVENPGAIALYSETGFVEVGRREGYYQAPGRAPVDAMILGLDLASPNEHVLCG